jgi:hypothetical protein
MACPEPAALALLAIGLAGLRLQPPASVREFPSPSVHPPGDEAPQDWTPCGAFFLFGRAQSGHYVANISASTALAFPLGFLRVSR